MIRKALFAIAATAAIVGAASSAMAGGYSKYGFDSGYNTYTHAPSYRYERRCVTKVVGHRKVYDEHSYGFSLKPVSKRFCKKLRVYH